MLKTFETHISSVADQAIEKSGHQIIHLFFSCRNLKDRDLFSISDPQIRVYSLENGKKQKIFETEVVKDSIHPDFTKCLIFNYIFEVKQYLFIEIIDIDDDKGTFDPLGEAQTCIGEIMGAPNQMKIYDVKLQGKKAGKLVVRGEIAVGNNKSIDIEFQGSRLKKMGGFLGFFGSTNPQFEMKREIHGSKVKVYSSDPEKNTRNPNWKLMSASMKQLFNNDTSAKMNFEVYHKNKKNQKLIGKFDFCLDDILTKQRRSWELKNPNKPGSTCGSVTLRKIHINQEATFLEYLRAGTQLNVMLGIDFTSSNGNPKNKNSLHYIDAAVLNQYENSIYQVCNILLDYDYDKEVPMFGFGAVIDGAKSVNHCFAMTGDEENPYAHGLDGIMAVYRDGMNRISEFSGPTYFHHILGKAIEYSTKEKMNGSKVYNILLIMTDGQINNMHQIVDLLCQAADFPLSVIIIGVGNDDFSDMRKLDGDSEPIISSRGEKIGGDLVQFVEFNRYKDNRNALAEAVLEEIPAQFLQYMKSQGIRPGQ